ncbi:hypothetical protein R1sor_007109 [Riccia sorocarpa]|uniref:DUF7869 domain-containing protein n=1 Tax=Riccia sorocarpa TaxID=122646 RepID=A0ABD3HPX3_9MARC
MAPASKRLVSKKLDLAYVAKNDSRMSVLSHRKSPVLEELLAEHHYAFEKGHYTQAGNGEGTIWSNNDNREETASSETRGNKDLEDRDNTSEEDMCDVSFPLMRRMSSPNAENYSPRRPRRYSSSPKGPSKDAYLMRRVGVPDNSARRQPMRRMGCIEDAELGSNGAEDNLLDLSPPAHAFITLPSNKSDGVPALQKGRDVRRHQTGSVTSPAKRTKKTSHVIVARLQVRFQPLRDQEQPLSFDVSLTRILTTEVLELSSDDSPVRKATPPTKFRAKDLRVDVPDDDISWLQRTPLTQNNTSAVSSLPLLDLSHVTMLGEDETILGLRLHRQQQGEERATGGRRRKKALSCPKKRLSDWKGPLPAMLYIQLDNTVRNGIVFAYLAMLVEKCFFRKIKVGFLIVGHTHDHVDQMFSRFSVALSGKKAFTMPQMQQVIQETYVPSPIFEVLEETWDFKTIVQSRFSPMLPLHDVTFNQQFKIALGGDNWPRL